MIWLLAGIVLLGLVVAVSRYCYRLVFYNRNEREEDPLIIPPGEQYQALSQQMQAMVRQLQSIPYEQVYITSRDGIRLAGKYYHFCDNAPVQLQFHGYRGSGIREFCGGYHIAKSMGFNAIVVDERAHGLSDGHTITFGIKERYDCLDWVNYACERFGKDTPILLSGVSMGAATVLMASDLDMPENVVAITADCPYSSPGEIIRKVSQDAKIPGWLAYPFVTLGALLFGGFRLWESSAVASVRNTDIPILLVHGEDDLFVPADMSRKIWEACKSKCRLLTVPKAGHGLSYLVAAEKYENTVKDFLEEVEFQYKK